MHDLRPTEPQAPQVANVNLHPDEAGHGPHPDAWASAVPSSGAAAAMPTPGGSFEVTGFDPAPAPAPPPVPPAAPQPAPVAPQPEPPIPPQPQAVNPSPAATTAAPLPQQDEHHHTLAQSLRTIKFGLVALIAILALAVVYFVIQGSPTASDRSSGGSNQSGGSTSNAPSPASPTSIRSVSCTGTTGTDASTDSKSFTDVEGTECSYRTGELPETLVLSGKLTGRNTEGTGMAATINVNGKVCAGGESLNYARTFTPMTSNCVFDVPANSAVAIKWQFLSPFGGSASVLRSSKNIAPSIVGTAIPKTEEDTGN